jgi:cyclase
LEKMRQVAPGAYVETKYKSGNVGFILTAAGVICVDLPMMPTDTNRWLAQIQSVTDKPLLFLIQTDYNRERVVSTGMVDVPVIAHEVAWERMKIYRNDKRVQQIRDLIAGTELHKSWQARMPDITFTERLILNKGSRTIHILYGGGHSPATCMVYLPENRLIFTGDLVYNNMHPTMAQAETKEWLSSLNQLRKLVVDTIVPGHGLVCGKECTHPLSDYIRDMRAQVRHCFQAERSKSETSSTIIPEFMDAFPYVEDERDRVRRRIKGGSDRIYDEYRAAARAGAAGSRNETKPRGRSRKRKSRAR